MAIHGFKAIFYAKNQQLDVQLENDSNGEGFKVIDPRFV